jgi:hypothetical protein
MSRPLSPKPPPLVSTCISCPSFARASRSQRRGDSGGLTHLGALRLPKYTARIFLERKLFISVIVVIVKGKSRYIFPSLPTAFASILIPYPAPTVYKPYCLSHPSLVLGTPARKRKAAFSYSYDELANLL